MTTIGLIFSCALEKNYSKNKMTPSVAETQENTMKQKGGITPAYFFATINLLLAFSPESNY